MASVSSSSTSAASPEPAPSRLELISRAYHAWHTELAGLAGDITQTINESDPAVIDLTRPHPTGGAQLYSGMPTLLTSLVREEEAQQVALSRLASLQRRIEELSERYGYAPVTMAIGNVTWSELPGGSVAAADLGAAYEVTGELHLDPESVRQNADEATGLVRMNDEDAATTQGGVPPSSAVDPSGAADEGRDGGDDAAIDDDAAISEARAIDERRGIDDAQTSDDGAAARTGEPSEEDAQVSVIEMSQPVLLRTVRLEPAGTNDAHITLTARCEVNPTLLRALRAHGIPAEDVSQLRSLAADPNREDEVLARVRELGRVYLPGFEYQVSMLLGSFVHPGQVLLSDLEAMKPYIETSGIMAALAGDEPTRRLSAAPLPPAERRDRAPEVERGAGDRDVAELAVVEAVASGRSVVVDTPPGSQRVGTLAAIAADAAASGRSMVYIPSRASAGRAFTDELNRLGLGDLYLDFADLDAVAMRLRTGLRLRSPELDDDATLDLRARLADVRRQLGNYVAALHEEDPNWHESVHSLLERLAALTTGMDAPKSRVRLSSDDLADLAENYEQRRELLLEAAELDAFVPQDAASAWAGATIASIEEGESAMQRVARLADELLPVVMAQSQRAAGETGLERAITFADWQEQLDMLGGVSSTLDVFVPQIYERSAMDMVIATASKEWRETHGEEMKGSERRRLTKQARDFIRPGATVTDLHKELVTVQKQREVWRRYCSEEGWPKLPDGMAQIKASADEARREIATLQAVLPQGRELRELPLEELLATVRRMKDDTETMSVLPRRNEILAQLRNGGLGSFLDDLASRGVSTADAVSAELELVYTSSIFEQLVGKSPELARMGPAELTELSSSLRQLDEAHTATLAGPVSRAAVRIMRETISKRRDDTMKLDAQLARYSTGGLRDAIAAYPRLVQVSRPVWVIPSMVAAEFVPPMPWVDIVVMDDMDGVRVSSAVSMLMRGRQIVVAGDLRRGDDDTAVKAFADVLPVCQLPTLRARHDELATQTLREQGYADVLEMVPSAAATGRSRLVVVDGRGVPSPTTGIVEGTQVEVDAVVDAVVDHVLTDPEHSLAVVCVSQQHAVRVREAIKKTAANSSALASLVSPDGPEPFAVLDIMQCAGLRRDSIILSVGYGKTVHGRVLHTFGSLATPDGVTGLVNAVESARDQLTIISALGPGEIGTDLITSPGPRLLAKLIDRAAGRDIPLNPAESGLAVDPLLADLAARVERAGWVTAANFGYEEGTRIPLVAGHHSLPGTWRVAVLLDDDAYMAEPSQRRRDRYWAERLEARGWSVVQTFSTSLFIDPVGQAERVIALLEEIRGQVVEAARGPATVAVPVLDDQWLKAEEPDGGELGAGDVQAVQAVPRGPRPQITAGLPLAAYSDDQLDEMVAWIASDAIPRAEDGLVLALREELDVRRRGSQTEAVLRNVVRRSGLATSYGDDRDSASTVTTGGLAALSSMDGSAANGAEGVTDAAVDDEGAANGAHSAE